jgi:hypothetical protein
LRGPENSPAASSVTRFERHCRWIDGQKEMLDEAWWLQKFTPRDSRSVWKKINRDKATRDVRKAAAARQAASRR